MPAMAAHLITTSADGVLGGELSWNWTVVHQADDGTRLRSLHLTSNIHLVVVVGNDLLTRKSRQSIPCTPTITILVYKLVWQ